MLSTLEKENLITYKDKQHLKVSFTTKETALMNMIALHIGLLNFTYPLDSEFDEELKFSILNYLQEKNTVIVKKDLEIRKNRRSKSTLVD
jgi:hypothetical protein